jgi:pimeloyl-ACP methyl ester carboxylesterase
MEPISHFFYSDRLKLQFWDYGQDGKPSLVLVHGGLDHARSWDWVARSLREHYHVYALDLRGHGNSASAPGAIYSIAEHILDLSVLLDIVGEFPICLMGHSLGAAWCCITPDSIRTASARRYRSKGSLCRASPACAGRSRSDCAIGSKRYATRRSTGRRAMRLSTPPWRA